MGQGIIKLGGRYLIWSTVVDAPITYGMTRQELKQYIREEHGNDGLRELPRRLERVEQKGTSFHDDESVDDTISCNRAGPEEKKLTKAGIIARYVTEGRKGRA